MPTYWICEKDTGNIKRVVSCREDHIEDQIQEGERYHVVSQPIDRTQYYRVTKEGKVKERQGERRKANVRVQERKAKVKALKLQHEANKLRLARLRERTDLNFIEREIVELLAEVIR